jgi:hypothetical protein
MAWWSGSRSGMAAVKTTAVHRAGARLFLAPEMMSPDGHNALYVFKLSEP